MNEMNESDENGGSETKNQFDDDMFTREVQDAEELKDRQSLGITDFVRKKLGSTMDQVQTTGSMSREALSYVIQQGDKGRKEVLRIVAQEVGDFLKNTDLSRELTKVLTGVKLDINASIAFKPADGERGVEPEIEHEVKLGTKTAEPEPTDPE